MKILITGAGGYIGSALTDHLDDRHDLRLSDQPVLETDHEFVQADVRDPDAVRPAVEGVDAVVHTPAWHGVHTDDHSDREFWELNVEGTFNVLEAATRAGVEHAVWLSSQAWYGGLDGIYPFTKVVGEETVEYLTNAHDEFSAVAIRPAAVEDPTGAGPTPVTDRKGFGESLLRGVVSLRDVVSVTTAALETDSVEWGAYPALRDDPYTVDELAAYREDPVGVLESYVPRAGELVDRYDLDLPDEINRCGSADGATMAPSREDLGHEGSDTFVTFLDALATHDKRGDAEGWLATDLD